MTESTRNLKFVKPETSFTSDEDSATLPSIPIAALGQPEPFKPLSQPSSALTPVRQPVVLEKAKVNPLVHFIAGGIGGMAGALFTCPLDVVKTRLQSDFYKNHVVMSKNYSTLNPVSKAVAHFSDTIQILRSVYKQEGSRALFKGLGPNLVGVIPARSINFFTYGMGKEFISTRFNDGKESTWVHLLAAVNAGLITSTATNPIWLIKTRLQLDKSEGGIKLYKNSLDCLVKVIKSEGIKGLYKGLSASYLGSAESTIQWVLYEQMKSFIRQKEIARQQAGIKASGVDKFMEWGAQSGAAGMAKLLASMITYPHEVVRTRLRQAPMANGKPKYTGLIQCFRLVIIEEGFWSMYGGLTPHLLRTVPNSIIMFGTFELIVKLFS